MPSDKSHLKVYAVILNLSAFHFSHRESQQFQFARTFCRIFLAFAEGFRIRMESEGIKVEDTENC